MVSPLIGRKLDDGLASPFFHDVAAKPRPRANDCASGAAADESLCDAAWMAYRQYAPIAPQTTINFGLTVALPEFQDLWQEN